MDSFPIINKTYEIYKELVVLNHKLEKRWRYSLGLSAENTVLELLEQLIIAGSAPKASKVPYLLRANAGLEILRLKLRLLLELKLANETKIFQLQAKLAEIGRMLGGWLKAAQGF